MTPFESYCRLHYLSQREHEQLASMGNIIRIATTILVNINLAKDKQIKDPRKLWRFGWEVDGVDDCNIQEVTSEQLKKISELL